MIKKIIVVSLIFIIALSVADFLYNFFTRKKPNIIKTYGNIEIRQVDLSFQVSGIIKDVFVEEGDRVKPGDLLAVLDDRDYKINYKKAYFQKFESKAQAKEDEQKYKKNRPLCKGEIISKQECETYLNTKDLSYAKYKQDIENEQYHLLQLNYTKMYAPQEGIITARVQEKGARVEKNQIVYVLSLNKPIWVRTYIKESDLGNIKYGKTAWIYTDTEDIKSKKKKKYKGYIGYISPVAEFTPKTVQSEDLRADLVYRIRVYIDEVDEYLRQGMPVSVEINLDSEE